MSFGRLGVPLTCLVLALSLGTTPVAFAQEAGDSGAPADTSAWTTELEGNLAASQAGYRNWAEGGVNTFAFSSSLQGAAAHTQGAWEESYDLRLSLGYIKTNGRSFRKSDDLIRLDAALTYQGGHGLLQQWNPVVAANLRTQFAPGFDYDANPFADGREPPVRISEFLAPATFSESVGLAYDAPSWFSQRFGLGGKQTLVRVRAYRPLYGLDLDETVRWEVGLDSKTELDVEVLENTRFRSTLNLFKSFNQAELPDMIWENLLTIRANRWLTTNAELVLVYDPDIREDLQIKEVLSLGVTFTIL